MKKLFYIIFILLSHKIIAQDTSAYQIFNTIYANDRFSYSLTNHAMPFRLNINRDSVFVSWCQNRIPDLILKSMLDQESKSFIWEQNLLHNTKVVSDSIASKHDKEYFSLSAPIYDTTKTYAIVYESLDAISCIHSGPVLLHYKDKKWEVVEQYICSYHLMRGRIITR